MQAPHTPTTSDKVLRIIMQPGIRVPLSGVIFTAYSYGLIADSIFISALFGACMATLFAFSLERFDQREEAFAFRAIKSGRASVIRRYNKLLKMHDIPSDTVEYEDYRAFLKGYRKLQERNIKADKSRTIFFVLVAVFIIIVTQQIVFGAFAAVVLVIMRIQAAKTEKYIETIDELLHQLDQRALRG